MKSSFFKEAIRLQFNALMMLTIKGTLKQKRKQLSKRSRHEVLFCEMNEIEMNPPTTIDETFFDMTNNSTRASSKVYLSISDKRVIPISVAYTVPSSISVEPQH